MTALDNTWEETAEAVINNWIGKLYQLTHRNRSIPSMEGVGADDPLGLGWGRKPAPRGCSPQLHLSNRSGGPQGPTRRLGRRYRRRETPSKLPIRAVCRRQLTHLEIG
jgi:hypothetical protein